MKYTKSNIIESSPIAWSDVYLTPLNDSDLDLLCDWQNAPWIRDLAMGFRFPVQTSAVKNWLRKIEEQNSKSKVVYGIRLRDQLVGVISLHHIEQFQRKSLLGIFIGDDSRRNQGIGFMSTCLILDFAFNGLDFRKVGLEVLAKNMDAMALYERVGFVIEGIKREEHFIDGKCIDTHIFGILKDEFKFKIPDDANRLLHTF